MAEAFLSRNVIKAVTAESEFQTVWDTEMAKYFTFFNDDSVPQVPYLFPQIQKLIPYLMSPIVKRLAIGSFTPFVVLFIDQLPIHFCPLQVSSEIYTFFNKYFQTSCLYHSPTHPVSHLCAPCHTFHLDKFPQFRNDRTLPSFVYIDFSQRTDDFKCQLLAPADQPAFSQMLQHNSPRPNLPPNIIALSPSPPRLPQAAINSVLVNFLSQQILNTNMAPPAQPPTPHGALSNQGPTTPHTNPPPTQAATPPIFQFPATSQITSAPSTSHPTNPPSPFNPFPTSMVHTSPSFQFTSPAPIASSPPFNCDLFN